MTDGNGRGLGGRVSKTRLRAAWIVVLGAVLVGGIALAVTFGGPQPAESAQFTASSTAGHTYLTYVPPAADDKQLPVVVMLHGCGQSARAFAEQTQMNQVAERQGVIVVYPDQTEEANRGECWNWFDDQQTTRGSGEAALIADITREVVETHDADEQRVYLAGFSAGGAMTTALSAAYPDLYAAVGVHSGLEYEAATRPSQALSALQSGGPDPQRKGRAAYEAMGEHANPVPTIVFHGTRDSTVAPINGQQVTEQAIQTIDLAIDGRDDADVDLDPELQRRGTINGTNYTNRVFRTSAGYLAVEQYVIEGLGHAWSGGAPDAAFATPAGPDASRLMWAFFERHTLNDSDRT